MTRPTPASHPDRLRLKIILDHIKPAIWRTIEVDGALTFLQLHNIIQVVMGWGDEHLHEFELSSPPVRIVMNQIDEPLSSPAVGAMLLEDQARLADTLGKRKSFRYWYDFGDDWRHTIKIEKHLPPDPAAAAAILIDGANACPPEDCGGPAGYANLRAALNPRHPGYEQDQEWLEDFDPADFEIEAARKLLVYVSPH
jgi:hypothetical protein